jgi:hypothetical protein
MVDAGRGGKDEEEDVLIGVLSKGIYIDAMR